MKEKKKEKDRNPTEANKQAYYDSVEYDKQVKAQLGENSPAKLA
jgi:hypothetical protein